MGDDNHFPLGRSSTFGLLAPQSQSEIGECPNWLSITTQSARAKSPGIERNLSRLVAPYVGFRALFRVSFWNSGPLTGGIGMVPWEGPRLLG